MIYIIHDNSKWLSNLKDELNSQKLEFTEWNLKTDSKLISNIDIEKEPPKGIFYNRVSASSHTREARYSLENCRILLSWLEKWNRKVINGSSTLDIEASKFRQYLELLTHSINIPKTHLATNKNDILSITKKHFFSKKKPCIIKDNRGGSGISVELFHQEDKLIEYLLSNDYTNPIDSLTLIQEYINSPENYITRLEFINQQFVYAVRVDTSNGFKLCPADKCLLKQQHKPKFQIIDNFSNTKLIENCINLMKKNNIDVCGMEFIKDKDNNIYVYDINCNTNYNSDAEKLKYGEKGKSTKLLVNLINS